MKLIMTNAKPDAESTPPEDGKCWLCGYRFTPYETPCRGGMCRTCERMEYNDQEGQS